MPARIASIDELFPPAELARRTALHERFWAGQETDRPIICPIAWKTNHNNVLDPEEVAALLPAALAVESRRDVDGIPAFNTMIGTCALASAFGGRTTQTEDGRFWIEPVVRTAEDAYRLKRPGVLDGLVGKSVENYLHIRDRLDGYLPPRVPDMQGPLNTASMIWRQEEFLLAMYDAPEAVHHLLETVTDHIVAVYRYFADTFRDANLVSWPFIYMPRRLGVGMTEDFMHLLSPGLYEEFGLPYVNRISREFGGLFIHCCGVFKQHWPVVRRIENLRGLDTMYAFSRPEELNEAFPDVVHTMWLDHAEGVRSFSGQGPEGFLRFLLDHTPRGIRRIYFPTADDEGELHRQIDMIRRHWRRLHA